MEHLYSAIPPEIHLLEGAHAIMLQFTVKQIRLQSPLKDGYRVGCFNTIR